MKKFIIAAALAALFGSPAFAQSFDPDYGTGNVRSFDVGPMASDYGRVAIRHDGRHAFAMVPRGGSSFVNSNDPAAAGGGSLGYNEHVYDSW
jgi:opacity protein-like surface antigen